MSEAAWRRFLNTRITPRFPQGLTVLSGRGQWRGPVGRLVREPTRVVLIVTDPTPEAVAALHAIRAEYADVFAQGAVGLVLHRGCSVF